MKNTNAGGHGNSFLRNPRVQGKLRRIIARLESNPEDWEDLLQVAWLRIWLDEKMRPDQTESWHLDRARRYLQHEMNKGRSLDSQKRGQKQVEFDLENDVNAQITPHLADPDIFSEIYADDEFQLLSSSLKPLEFTLLSMRFRGFSSSDIERELHVSGQKLNQCLAHIASLAGRLGISPM